MKKIAMHFSIVHFGSLLYEQAVSLREEILRKPHGLFFTPKELAAEKHHIHIIGEIAGRLCATAALVPEGKKLKMQRVAVRSDSQNQGIGSALLAFCEHYAIEHGYHALYCHARDSAIPFYRKNGYNPSGDFFEEDGIPHLKMIKLLSELRNIDDAIKKTT